MSQGRFFITCECGQSMRVSDSQIGQQGTCIRCGKALDLSPNSLEILDGSNGAPPADGGVAPEWSPGDVLLGLYEVVSVLGEGGMGKVYKVRHRAWDMDLAVKCPRPAILERRGGVAKFERECATWINLGLHPHIVTCYYVRRLGGIPRVFAEYVEGGSLWTWIRERRLYEGGPDQALARMLDVAIQFAWGLQHAHERGFVHQDVKPSNLLLSSGCTAKVCDFGLAKALNPEDNEDEARGMTRVYRSPEQAGGGEITPQTDMWGWGLSVLEMFLGRHRWRYGEEAPLALRRYLAKAGSAPPEIPRMPRPLAELLVRCFRERPSERPKDMAEIARVLRTIYRERAGGEYFRQAPRPADALSDSLNNRAVSLLDLGRHEDAMRLWKDALRSDPHHPDSTYNMGLVQWRTGEITDDVLLMRLREIDRLHPGDPLAPHRLVQVHLERGDYAAALPLLEEIDGAGPGRPEIASAIATARERRETSRSLVKTFTGHNDTVTAVAIGMNARLGISGSDDNTIRLWDLETGSCRRVLEGHTNTVRALCLQKGAHYAASGSADKTIRVWRLAGNTAPEVLEGHGGPVRALSLSDDGRLLVSAAEDKSVRVWDLDTRQCVATCQGHTHWVTAAQISPDGRHILSAGYDRTLRLWNAETGTLLRTLEGHDAAIEAAAWSADGRFAVSGDESGALRVWLLPVGQCLRQIRAHAGSVRALSIGPDGRFAVSGGLDGRIRLWDLGSGRCLCTFDGHAGGVHGVGLDPGGHYILSSGGRDREVRLWRAECAAPVRPATLMVCRAVAGEAASTAGHAYAQAVKAARTALASGDAVAAAGFLRTARSQPGRRRAPDTMREWRTLYSRLPRKGLEGGWEALAFDTAGAPITALRMARRQPVALSLAGQNTLQLWDLQSGTCLQTFGSEAGPLRAIDLSEDGRLAAAGFWDIRLWDTETGMPVGSLERQSDGIHALALSPDAQLVASGGSEWLRLWHVKTAQCLWATQGHAGDVTAVAWSRDGGFILSGGEDQNLVLWDAARCEAVRVLRAQCGPIRAVSISDDGRCALAAGTSRWGTPGRLVLFDLVSGRCVQKFEGHGGDAETACLSADGRYVVSGGEDKSVRLWDSSTGRCILTLGSHAVPLAGVALAPDAGLALSADRGGHLKTWLLDWDLEDRAPADWDNGVLPYIRVFLSRQTPYGPILPSHRAMTEADVKAALTRHGRPTFGQQELDELLEYLGALGYGWLRPESVTARVRKAATAWTAPPRVYRSAFAPARGFARKLKNLLGR